jgi:hypothetical protein
MHGIADQPLQPAAVLHHLMDDLLVRAAGVGCVSVCADTSWPSYSVRTSSSETRSSSQSRPAFR